MQLGLKVDISFLPNLDGPLIEKSRFMLKRNYLPGRSPALFV